MIDYSLTLEGCAVFFALSLAMTAFVFLLSLLFGWLTALARAWRTKGFEKLCKWVLNPCLAVLRRVPPVGMLLFTYVLWLNDELTGYFIWDISLALSFFLLAACFAPDISDALLGNLQRIEGDAGSRTYILRLTAADGGGASRFIKHSRSITRQAWVDSIPAIGDTLGEVWKVSYVVLLLFMAGHSWYSQVYASVHLVKNCIILSIVYWLAGLAIDLLMRMIVKQLQSDLSVRSALAGFEKDWLVTGDWTRESGQDSTADRQAAAAGEGKA